MGNAKRTKPHEPDYVLLLTVGALVAGGLVMVYSASFVEAFTLHDTQFYYLLRQMIGALIGTIGLVLALRVNYRLLRRFSLHIMGAALLLLILVLVLPTSLTEVNGSRSWIRFSGGLLSVQPSEIAKLAMIIYFADWLSKRGDKIGNATYGLIPFSVLLGLVCGLVILQPDVGTTTVLLLIGGLIYFAAGANLLHIILAIGVAALAFGGLVNFAENGRILAYHNPWDYYDSYGYQPIHALYALGSGGLFGVGLGQARQKFQWLPQAHTDSIYAIIGEELGLVGTLLVLVGFAIIAYRGYRIACRSEDPFAALVAVGITSWLVFQALLNMAVTTSLVPFTGLTLPFISYGSTSLIMCMVGVGLLLNISRYTVTRQPEEKPDAWSRRSPALDFFRATRQTVAAAPVWGWYRRPRLSGAGSRRSPGRATARRSRTGGR
ncbi:MAG: putative lipid II flippase FtsW [Chloroflexaceae bacterium]|nr:putative lipid II flippase FtsW [Chloroflexaceae bacterium]